MAQSVEVRVVKGIGVNASDNSGVKVQVVCDNAAPLTINNESHQLDIKEGDNYNVSIEPSNSAEISVVPKVTKLLKIGGGSNGNDLHYRFTQSLPLVKWTIQHDLNKYCSVSVVNSANEIVYGDVEYINKNKLEITFSDSFSGYAILAQVLFGLEMDLSGEK